MDYKWILIGVGILLILLIIYKKRNAIFSFFGYGNKKQLENNIQEPIMEEQPPDTSQNIPLEEYKDLDREILNHEPKNALTDGENGLLFYERFAEIFKDIINSDGRFFIEIGFGKYDDIEPLFLRKNFEVDIISDLAKIKRIITGYAKY